ncbi:hypothetical protein VX037_17610 [Gordonia sp. Z-3]|uniref:hypothetical protein n=1 Tax=unclassified Gordonia (in: high G+C Gram-positive bacteria) TaxID=2657482 RepID=UPI002E282C01|nr:hypothetical protein [Gordonia sp. Z-3]MED5802848.1 hypothetical protein [Gordonia sp. Z-3]
MTHSVTTVGRGAAATTRSPVRRLSAGFLREVAESQRARDIDPSPLFLLVNITENGAHVSTIDPETAAVVADRRDRMRRPGQRDVAAMCHTAELTAPGHIGSVVLSTGHDSSPDLVATIEAQTELPVLVVEPRSPHAGGGAMPTPAPTAQTPPDPATDPTSDRPAEKRQWLAKPRVALGIVAVCAIIGVGTALVFAAVIAVFAGDDVDNPDGLSAFVGDEQTSAPADPAGGGDDDSGPKQPDPVNPGQVEPTQLDAARRPAAQYVPPPPPEPTWSATDPAPGGPPQRRTPGEPAPPPPPAPAPAPIPAPPPPQQRTIPNPIPGLPPIVVPF